MDTSNSENKLTALDHIRGEKIKQTQLTQADWESLTNELLSSLHARVKYLNSMQAFEKWMNKTDYRCSVVTPASLLEDLKHIRVKSRCVSVCEIPCESSVVSRMPARTTHADTMHFHDLFLTENCRLLLCKAVCKNNASASSPAYETVVVEVEPVEIRNLPLTEMHEGYSLMFDVSEGDYLGTAVSNFSLGAIILAGLSYRVALTIREQRKRMEPFEDDRNRTLGIFNRIDGFHEIRI